MLRKLLKRSERQKRIGGKKREEKKRKEEEERKLEADRKRKAEEERKLREEADRQRKAEEARKERAADQSSVQGQSGVPKPPPAAPIVTSKGLGRYVSSGASSGGAGGYNPNVIGAKDTVGDIYYKTYTEEERGDAPHQAPWSLRQKDTFVEFGPSRDWYLNQFTPGEVNRQKAKPHEMLYRTYILAEANARSANHQIVREWRTMVRERADWEAYRERVLKRVGEFEKAKATFDEEKAKFEADRKAEEWGREGLQKKLHNVEEQLAKEKAEFKRICAQDNERAYAARQKIVGLEAKIAELTSKVEEAQVETAAKQQMEAKKKTPEKKGVELKDPKEPAQKKTKFVINHLQTTMGTIEKIIEETYKEKEKEKEGEKEKEKKKAVEKPEGDKLKETQTAATTAQDKAQGPEVVHITGLGQPLHEKKKETTWGKGPEVVKPTKPVQVDAPTQTVHVTSTTGGGVSCCGA
ncbi:hypothetical protein HanHA89_Chr09g0319571 [Helianthus annuus]|nr:hypothetical protein HanHA89_Chr09g0319571 [Helianthus annuus]